MHDHLWVGLRGCTGTCRFHTDALPCRVDYCLSGKAEAGAAVACNCRAPNCRGAL